MIEVLWKNEKGDSLTQMMMKMTQLFSWLMKEIHENKYHINLKGYMILLDTEFVLSGLLLPGDKESQNQLIKILQQPPGEFTEKYIARIPAEEPVVVDEIPKEEIECSDSESESEVDEPP